MLNLYFGYKLRCGGCRHNLSGSHTVHIPFKLVVAPIYMGHYFEGRIIQIGKP